MLMFKRTGPAWKITADIWNTSTPREEELPDAMAEDSVAPVIS